MVQDNLSSGKKLKIKDKKIDLLRNFEEQSNPLPDSGYTEPIEDGKNVWAYYRAASTRELQFAGMAGRELNVIFYINWRDNLLPLDMVRYEGTVYKIDQIDDFEGYKEDMKITASAIIGAGANIDRSKLNPASNVTAAKDPGAGPMPGQGNVLQFFAPGEVPEKAHLQVWRKRKPADFMLIEGNLKDSNDYHDTNGGPGDIYHLITEANEEYSNEYVNSDPSKKAIVPGSTPEPEKEALPTPENFAAEEVGGEVVISWDHIENHEFATYTVERNEDPSPSVSIAERTATNETVDPDGKEGDRYTILAYPTEEGAKDFKKSKGTYTDATKAEAAQLNTPQGFKVIKQDNGPMPSIFGVEWLETEGAESWGEYKIYKKKRGEDKFSLFKKVQAGATVGSKKTYLDYDAAGTTEYYIILAPLAEREGEILASEPTETKSLNTQ